MSVLKYKKLIEKIAREECRKHGMKEMIEDAIQEGYLALIEMDHLQLRETEVVQIARERIREMLKRERREKYVRDQLKDLGATTSTLKADILREAEYLLHERGILVIRELLRRLEEVGINPPSRSTLYRWLREWRDERGLKQVVGYILPP